MKDYYIVAGTSDCLEIYESLEEIAVMWQEECGADDTEVATDRMYGVIKITAAKKPTIQNIHIKKTLTLK